MDFFFFCEHIQLTSFAAILAYFSWSISGWDLNFIKPTRVFQGHTHGVYHCDVKSIAGASTHLTTAGGDGLVKIYDFRSCKAELTIWAHGGPTTRVQYLDNYTLLTSGHDGRLRMWDIRRPSAQLAKPLWFGSSILSFFYNGTTLITGTANALFCCSMGLNHLKLGVFDEEIEEVRHTPLCVNNLQ
jgi:WD40 repeat protein